MTRKRKGTGPTVEIGPVYRYRAACERVVDGDTYRLRVDLGFGAGLSINGRLRDVNCPELSTEAGKAARAYAESRLMAGPPTPLILESYRDRQSFARWIVDIWLPGGQALAADLIAAGHGTSAAA